MATGFWTVIFDHQDVLKRGGKWDVLHWVQVAIRKPRESVISCDINNNKKDNTKENLGHPNKNYDWIGLASIRQLITN